ncbi:huntingtin [Cylas formicarius]|uniref:huntingtin n=1 Tax=Cylas formicarius TaxID=197179 RepID=UPI002958C8B3|nr:huntingtin [Cylas formicarius]
MATQEKLQKSLESLKNLLNSNQQTDNAKKKEKIHHCLVITEAISNPTIRISANFSVLLGVTIETFLTLCDDSDSDVRMRSDECLNKIIRSVTEGHIGKVQIELHKEIKKNGSARSLRLALMRFSQLAHHIRPHKGKPYIVNLFPSIIKITERSEESIHETLASCLPKIMKVLGCFAPENETKILLKSFLKNISNPSAVIRRTSASSILIICLNSKRPYTFVTYCTDNVLDLVIPVEDKQNIPTIMGVLGCLKVLLPYLKDTPINYFGSSREEIQIFPLIKLLQIYELCMYYLKSENHNVINAAFETLNILLQTASVELKATLLNPRGIDKARIYKNHYVSHLKSPSQLSVVTNSTSVDDNLFSDCELTETIESDMIEKWIGESKLSVINVPLTITTNKSVSVDTLTGCSDSNFQAIDLSGEKMPEIFEIKRKSSSVGDQLDVLSDRSSENSYSVACDLDEVEYQELDVGDYMEMSVPLLYCTRFITKSFLLSGVPKRYVSDKLVRVSVKASALSCLSSVFRIYPAGFFQFLDKNCNSVSKGYRVSPQRISEIVLFADHPDLQLRGALRSLIANLIVAILHESGKEFDVWISVNGHQDCFSEIDNFIDILLKGLQDENANCLRQILLNLCPVLNGILVSSKNQHVLPILARLPFLAYNPYWLVKVALAELVAKLCYTTIYHVTGNNKFQNKTFNVLLLLLQDYDQRIRTASANAVAEIVKKFYYDDFCPKDSVVVAKAIEYCKLYLTSLSTRKLDTHNLNIRHFMENMPTPYSYIAHEGCDRLEFTLSKIVSNLYISVLKSSSKHFIFGCVEALSMLSTRYPCTVYRRAWTNLKASKSSNSVGVVSSEVPDLLSLCINFLTGSAHVYDIRFQIHVISLAANLFAGYSVCKIEPPTDMKPYLWHMFSDKSFRSLCEQYLTFIMKLLNIFHHVINDITPVSIPNKTSLPHLPAPSTISPIKRRKSDLEKKQTQAKASEKDEKKTCEIGSFVQSQHYMKIFENLRNSFANYKISLEPEASEKFVDLLKNTLNALSVIMEVATLNEFGRMAEEILTYMKSTFTMDPNSTMQCVQQLLKCLFDTNLTANLSSVLQEIKSRDEAPKNCGLFYNLFQNPYDDIASSIEMLRNNSKIDYDGDYTIMGYLHRPGLKSIVSISKASDKTLADYIRIFEPMVIKSLKQYTVTSDVRLQSRVLQLLNQLVQLRVNYCLLDSEQVFKDFVLKQFEYIEEGQISFSEELIPKIFQFFVSLSYSKQHSKNIISIPKIIQLCDGLMASGQDPLTHCIPALEPIIEDIFLIRNKANTTDMNELETTREVMLSMLLRLFEYKEVVKLITLILEDSKYCIDDPTKWFRWSGQAVQVFLQCLKVDKMKLDDADAFHTLWNFVLALHPKVFESVGDIVVMIFQSPPQTDDSVALDRWLSKIIILLFILTSLKEDDLLWNIDEVKAEFNPGSIFQKVPTTADPLNVHNNADVFNGISPEELVSRLYFRVASVVSGEILKRMTDGKVSDFLVSQLTVFLLCCSYTFQSGSHCKISRIASTLVGRTDCDNTLNINEVNERFLKIGGAYPTLTLYWGYVLSFLNFKDILYWEHILSGFKDGNCRMEKSINKAIVQQGGTILLCDYLTENSKDIAEINWTLTNHCYELVLFVEELPVYEFICFVHRSPEHSKTFIEGVMKHCLTVDNPVFKTRILKSIETCHCSQLGAVVKLLVPEMLYHNQVAVSGMASSLASRKVELLLTFTLEEVHSQLTREEIFDIKRAMRAPRRHETLKCLLNKLLIQFYELSPLEFDASNLNASYVRTLNINKDWYLSEIKKNYSNSTPKQNVAAVIDGLEFEEIVNFLSDAEFGKIFIGECIKFGMSKLISHDSKEEPLILKAAVQELFSHISDLLSNVFLPHDIFQLDDPGTNCNINDYTSTMIQVLYRDLTFPSSVENISVSLLSLLESAMPEDIARLKISQSCFSNIFKFAVMSLEFIDFSMRVDKTFKNIKFLDLLLHCSSVIFSHTQQLLAFVANESITWLCSAVNSLHKIVTFLLKGAESIPLAEMYGTSKINPSNPPLHACHRLYVLITWIQSLKSSVLPVGIPNFLFVNIKSVIISVARLPVFNSYILVPEKVWKSGWDPIFSGEHGTQVPPLHLEFLQEVEIFQEYMFRISLLGWATRQQFEETWMCFLSVLCCPIDNRESDEFANSIYVSSQAVRAITVLLLQTLRIPVLGNESMSMLLHASRNKVIRESQQSIKKLKLVQRTIENEFLKAFGQTNRLVNVFEERNFEKCSDHYSYGQLSVKYFLAAVNPEMSASAMSTKRAQLLEECGLDVNSCLQFLLEYYNQLLSPESAMCDLRMLHETVRSIVFISDLFTDVTQFKWMQDTFLTLVKTHSVEDELLHQYLILGICKSVGVLNPDLEIYEQTKRLLVQFMKSNFLPSRISCLYGMLYILEGCLANNVKLDGLSEEMQLILPCAVEYIQNHLNTSNCVLKKSLEHTLLVWSVAFFIIENVEESHVESNFFDSTLQKVFEALKSNEERNIGTHLIKGLERLMLTRQKLILDKIGKQIYKLALETMKVDDPSTSILGIQLMVTYMYTDCSEQLEKQPCAETSPEQLVQTIEKISALFETIKKGYQLEVQVLCAMLPSILKDFFSPSDILTKVIGEFLSPQQPHPKLMSGVVFKVFESAIEQNQLSLLQDWVVFSLSNFTQSSSINMATWCLTCFFISASTNKWLRALFPHVQTRIGRYEHEDRAMLCIAGSDFYRNLTNDKQKVRFVENFQSVKDPADMMFRDLLNSL